MIYAELLLFFNSMRRGTKPYCPKSLYILGPLEVTLPSEVPHLFICLRVLIGALSWVRPAWFVSSLLSFTEPVSIMSPPCFQLVSIDYVICSGLALLVVRSEFSFCALASDLCLMSCGLSTGACPLEEGVVWGQFMTQSSLTSYWDVPSCVLLILVQSV